VAATRGAPLFSVDVAAAVQHIVTRLVKGC
jgi:hypothetical protein